MTINEVEARTGLDRGTVRYYETEGLIKPERRANGYREYSEADVEKLEKVKLLRALRFSLDDIKAMDADGGDFAERLRARMGSLEASAADLDDAKRVLERMLSDNASYETLDTGLYLGVLADRPEALPAADEKPDDERWRVRVPENAVIPAEPVQEASVWRRFFARNFDTAVYYALFAILRGNVLHIPQRDSGWQTAAELAFAAVMFLLVEPVELHLFGTTLGKWIMGISVTDREGRRPGYGAALLRTWRVLLTGQGFGIPVLWFILNVRGFLNAIKGRELFWEEGTALCQKGWSRRRTALYLLCVACVACLNFTMEMLAVGPVNRGRITPAELAENYNTMRKMDGVSGGWALQPDGSWVDRMTSDPSFIVIEPRNQGEPPETVEYTIEGGAVTKLRFVRRGSASSDTVWSLWAVYDEARYLVMSLVGAESGPFGAIRAANAIKKDGGAGFEMTLGGWYASFKVDTNGALVRNNMLIIGEKDAWWTAELVVEKLF